MEIGPAHLRLINNQRVENPKTINNTMKKLAILAVCLVSGLTAWAQGTVNFANGGAGVNAPIFLPDGTTRTPANGSFKADLWYGPAGIAAGDTLNAGLQSFGLASSFSTSSAGFFFGGSQTLPVGGTVSLQVRAWDGSTGATWALATTRGQSQVVQAALGVPPGPVPNILGLASFSLAVVPEPSTFALGALGLVGMLMFRRRK